MGPNVYPVGAEEAARLAAIAAMIGSEALTPDTTTYMEPSESLPAIPAETATMSSFGKTYDTGVGSEG